MRSRAWISICIVTLLGFAGAALYWTHSSKTDWQKHASPGALSRAHATLTSDCESCHTPVQGVEPDKCIACHANNVALLQRQPTSFHASVTQCVTCHVEHQGVDGNLRAMDHDNFSRTAIAQLADQSRASGTSVASLPKWFEQGHSSASSREDSSVLSCYSCHSTVDRHQTLFGTQCNDCHATDNWLVAHFQHPSPNSMQCSECHKAPPSHYMMHFDMVSKRVARQEDTRVAACCGVAQVRSCYRCHQTTSWNDIRGVGWYKHH